MASEGNGFTHYLVSKEVSTVPSLRTTPSFPKPRTNPLRLPTHKQQDPPNNSFHLCTVGGVCSCRLPCSPAKVTKVTKVTKIR